MIKYINSNSFEGDTISLDLNTNVLPVLSVDTYSVMDDIWDSIYAIYPESEEAEMTETENFSWENFEFDWNAIDRLIMREATVLISEIIREVLPSATITPIKVYHPKFYNFETDEFDFNLTCSSGDYRKLEQSALNNSSDFGAYLKERYHSYSGFISMLADNLKEFSEQDFWKQFVQVVMYSLRNMALDMYQDDYNETFSTEILDDPYGYLTEE